eukprot:1927-Chlamydomonas_euryale.AAC.1
MSLCAASAPSTRMADKHAASTGVGVAAPALSPPSAASAASLSGSTLRTPTSVCRPPAAKKSSGGMLPAAARRASAADARRFAPASA